MANCPFKGLPPEWQGPFVVPRHLDGGGPWEKCGYWGRSFAVKFRVSAFTLTGASGREAEEITLDKSPRQALNFFHLRARLNRLESGQEAL